MQIFNMTFAARRAQEIVNFAEKPENWYRLGVAPWVPGDRKEFVLSDAGSIRAVFSWTWISDSAMIRHLSVSARSGLPQPIIVWTLAHLFGFKGAKLDEHGFVHDPSETWVFDRDEKEGCIVVQEAL